MIDDPLDGQLLTLRRVVATTPPPRDEIMLLVRRNQVKRARTRRVAGGLAAVVVASAGLLSTVVFDGGERTDISGDVGVGPEVEANAPNSDVGGDDDGCNLAGPDAEYGFHRDDVSAVEGALEARFTSCFGGIARTGPNSADLWVVDEVPEVAAAAQEMLGPDFEISVLPSDHALADIRATKELIDENTAQLHASGIDITHTAIRIEPEGPRVLVGLSPYSREAAEQLKSLYGDDVLLIEEYGNVIPG